MKTSPLELIDVSSICNEKKSYIVKINYWLNSYS